MRFGTIQRHDCPPRVRGRQDWADDSAQSDQFAGAATAGRILASHRRRQPKIRDKIQKHTH